MFKKKDEIVCNVYKTTDYDKFKLLQGNRRVNLHNLRRIKDSLASVQLMTVVIVNSRFEIIDGQHRYLACKELSLPVYYLMCEDYGLKEVQVLNSNSSNWRKEDYLKSYCDLGRKEYLRFREFQEMFPEFPFMGCLALLTKGVNTRGKQRQVKVNNKSIKTFEKSFENGFFKITDWDFAVKSAEKIMAIKPYYDGFKRQNFIIAMIQCFKIDDFSFSTFMTKLSYQSVALQDCTSMDQYKTLIEEIYNYRNSKKINIRFAA